MFGKLGIKKRELEMAIDKDCQKVECILKKDAEAVKKDIKKLEGHESFNVFITYGWAITVIIVGIIGLIWWNFYSIQNESCEFLDGSGLLCQRFNVDNSSLTLEIRNLNNKSVLVEQIKLYDCSIKPNQTIADNDKRSFSVPCNISSGRFSERLAVYYTLENFSKNTVAKIRKIVP